MNELQEDFLFERTEAIPYLLVCLSEHIVLVRGRYLIDASKKKEMKCETLVIKMQHLNVDLVFQK